MLANTIIRREDIADPDRIMHDASITFALSLATRASPTALEALHPRQAQSDDWLNGLRFRLAASAERRSDDVGADWRNACHQISAPLWTRVETTARAILPSASARTPHANADETIAWLEAWLHNLRDWNRIERDPITQSGLEAVIAEIETRCTALRAVQRVSDEPSSVAWNVALHMACQGHAYYQRIRSELAVKMTAIARTMPSNVPDPADHPRTVDPPLDHGFFRNVLTTAFIAYAIANRDNDSQCAAWIGANLTNINDWMRGRRLVLQHSEERGRSWADDTARRAMTAIPDEVKRLADALTRTGTMTDPMTVKALSDIRATEKSVAAIIDAMRSDMDQQTHAAAPQMQSSYILSAMSADLEVQQRARDQLANMPRNVYVEAVILEREHRGNTYYHGARRALGLTDQGDRLVVTRRPKSSTLRSF